MIFDGHKSRQHIKSKVPNSSSEMDFILQFQPTSCNSRKEALISPQCIRCATKKSKACGTIDCGVSLLQFQSYLNVRPGSKNDIMGAIFINTDSPFELNLVSFNNPHGLGLTSFFTSSFAFSANLGSDFKTLEALIDMPSQANSMRPLTLGSSKKALGYSNFIKTSRWQ